MKSLVALAVLATAASFVLPREAGAVGCLSGAAVGGVAGHYAGRHGLLGAAAGCAVGHHAKVLQNRRDAEEARRQGFVDQPGYNRQPGYNQSGYQSGSAQPGYTQGFRQ